MPEITDPSALWGLEQGKAALGAHTRTEKGQLSKYFQRMGVKAPEYMASAYGVQDQAERNAMADLQAKMGMSQLRKQLHDQKLNLMWKQYRANRRGDKSNMWSSLLGSAGMIGGGLLGSLFKKKGGAVAGEAVGGG